MEVEIKIVIEPENIDEFDSEELKRDIVFQFKEITGYEIDLISHFNPE